MNTQLIDEAWAKARAAVPRADLRKLEPGIYLGLSFQDYQSIDAINRSSLSLVKQSLLHYKFQSATEETPSLAFGTLCHHGKLEPEQLLKRYVVLPQWELDAANVTAKGDRTESKLTTYYKDKKKSFLALHPGKQEVSQEWINNMVGVVKSVEEHPIAGPLFASGQPEVTLVWDDPDTKLRCKARLDWIHTEGNFGGNFTAGKPLSGKALKLFLSIVRALCDLKTTQDCCEFWLDKYDYHMQAGFYSDGWRVLTDSIIPFQFAAVEPSRPYACRCAPASDNAIMQGRVEYSFCLSRVLSAVGKGQRGKWTGPTDPAAWDVSPWYKQNFRDWHPAS